MTSSHMDHRGPTDPPPPRRGLRGAERPPPLGEGYGPAALGIFANAGVFGPKKLAYPSFFFHWQHFPSLGFMEIAGKYSHFDRALSEVSTPLLARLKR